MRGFSCLLGGSFVCFVKEDVAQRRNMLTCLATKISAFVLYLFFLSSDWMREKNEFYFPQRKFLLLPMKCFDIFLQLTTYEGFSSSFISKIKWFCLPLIVNYSMVFVSTWYAFSNRSINIKIFQSGFHSAAFFLSAGANASDLFVAKNGKFN